MEWTKCYMVTQKCTGVPRQALVSFSKCLSAGGGDPTSTLATGSLLAASPVPSPTAATPPPHFVLPSGGGPLYIQVRGSPGGRAVSPITSPKRT